MDDTNARAGLEHSATFSMITAMSQSVSNKHADLPFMTDVPSTILDGSLSRVSFYTDDMMARFRTAIPQYHTTDSGEIILYIEGHEIMASYQRPYMQALADIVTRKGGDILNIGYGLGLLDAAIEQYRSSRAIGAHFVIEINEHIAACARSVPHLTVLNADWNTGLDQLGGHCFDGVVYDGFPLSFDTVHRDGVIFIDALVRRGLLASDGILTFFVDAVDTLGEEFRAFLNCRGLQCTDITRVPVEVPCRTRQTWQQDYFLAPIVRRIARDEFALEK